MTGTRYVLESSFKGTGDIRQGAEPGAEVAYELNVYRKEQELGGSWVPVGFKDARVSLWSIRELEPGFMWQAFRSHEPVTLTLEDGQRQKLVMRSYNLVTGAADFVATGGLEPPRMDDDWQTTRRALDHWIALRSDPSASPEMIQRARHDAIGYLAARTGTFWQAVGVAGLTPDMETLKNDHPERLLEVMDNFYQNGQLPG